MGRRRRVLVGAVVASLLAPGAAPVVAVDDLMPPVGTVAVIHDDRDAELIRLSVPASDDLSGVATVEVSGDGTTWASYPYAPEVDWSVFDPASGGAPGLGNRTVRVRWTDGVGNVSAPITTRLYLGGHGALEFPLAPVTGQLFTIRPIYPTGATLPPDDPCSWELRWGDTTSLKFNKWNDTFGSLFLSGKPDSGFCGEWTFTIPHVPVPQFEVYFNSSVFGAGDEDWEFRAKFYPAAGSTDRRIRSSNLPMVQVLPDSYTIIVGQPITYRAYPIGTTLKANDTWIAFWPPSCGCGLGYKIKYGGSTFTFTPPISGSWLVGWTGRESASRPYTLGATYDPKARNPDRYRPDTTAPKQRIGGGVPGANVPVTLEWSGSDKGWGIAKYKLQRSVDGGSWQSVGLPTAKTTSIIQQLATGHRYQYRVRAVDKFGNVGFWDYGPTFRPKLVGDASTSLTFSGAWTTEPDASALGGGQHQSGVAGAWAKLTFTGRDVALIAERGPGMGRAKVYVDGNLRATIDLGAATDTARSIVFRRHWSTLGTHVVKVVVEGTLGRPLVTLDAVAILR